MRGKSLMIQGTASSVGKSLLCAAFLRIMRQDGLRAAPFKAQNMALNSFVTKDGREIGRAQATQAFAAGMEPEARMNPVLLKPTGDRRSQVMVNGRAVGSMSAMEYHRFKPELRPVIRAAYDSLEASSDCVVIEGAGSPAEINLRDGDIVNMGMAEMADAPVLLVGDINPGGVFASLLGTVMLLTEEERVRVKGVLINKFRGDPAILAPGLRMLEERIHVPVLGVVPWMDAELEDEDSLTERFRRVTAEGGVDVAVVRLAHISNFTDFQALALQGGVRVRYAERPSDLKDADIIILPGTKNTIEDLLDLRRHGMEEAILRHAKRGGMVVGVCGGYQMLAGKIRDPLHTESALPEISGLGLLDMEVAFEAEKTTRQSAGVIACEEGWLREWNGMLLDGYEIHAGKNAFGPGCVPWLRVRGETDGVMNPEGNVLGTYLHGLFDGGQFFPALCARVRGENRTAAGAAAMTMKEFRESELDRIAAVVRESVDMERIYRIVRGEI